MDDIRIVTCSSPVNIAVIKYWGKRDEQLILPVNSSLSGTLSQDELRTITTIAQSKQFKCDRIWLNGIEEDINNPRLQSCLREMRLRSRIGSTQDYVHIVSINNFPTAAGLASSASGYACLVYTLAQLFNVEGDVSDVARMGSGSACRSLYGGFVKWEMGTRPDGRDSRAFQVVPDSHWPEMRVLVCVVSDKKKDVSSTSGMKTTIDTSTLMQHRVTIVPERMKLMEAAIQAKNFSEFAKLTMQDSNQFHAVCLDTYPPITYMNDTSRRIVHILTKYNALHSDGPRAAYTFDAGPNAVIYVLEKYQAEVAGLLDHYFPSSKGDFFRPRCELSAPAPQLCAGVTKITRTSDELNYVLCTRVGPGPQVLEAREHLIDATTGTKKA